MIKSLFQTPVARIIFLFISMVLTTFLLGGFVLNGLLRIPAPMANAIVIIAILLITRQAYKKEGRDLSALGLDLTWKNFRFALLGLLLGAVFIIPAVYLIAWIKGLPVVFNAGFSGDYVLSGLWLLLPTVVLEELAFRGICFQKTIALSSVKTANIIFAGLFILSHWLNLNAFGNPVLMTLLLITGLGHVLFATALLRSKTLFFPIGIHLGNNWMSLFVFSNLDIRDPTALQVQPALINVIGDGKMPLFKVEFLITTLATALLYLLFILAIRHWIKREQ